MKRIIVGGACLLLLASRASATVGAEDVKRLGDALTGVGAEKAGNGDGSIPEYAGGLTTPPPGYKTGSGSRVDPFADEKPLFAVDGKNLGAHEAKLSEGVKAMLRKYPGYRLDVYRTHRTVALPKNALDRTATTAPAAHTTNNGQSLVGAHAAVPFPIPQNGAEAIWNHLVRYQPACTEVKYSAWFVEPGGRNTLSSSAEGWIQSPYWQPNSSADSNVYFRLRLAYDGPPRRAGEALMFVDPVDYAERGRRAYQYLPGQRRVKLAPDLAYDTPNPATAGSSTYDEVYLFNGALDRFDFTLVGKKELYVPYNAWRAVYQSTPDQLLKANFLSPDQVRWELHRVWVVEAKLKPGKRHIYSRRTFYLDEDSWYVLLSDEYDARGQLYRTGTALMAPLYDAPSPAADTHVVYDLSSGAYGINVWPGAKGWVRVAACKSENSWAPEALAAASVR
ncbi:MAG TPA: DUF1329 domain-containing protein [Anaeromyxobacteraceae bacterium]|jgi:hypothetical protein|nr:DUF1329 domain-containing protein [Anaeromyxobacteraceae bacterium]